MPVRLTKNFFHQGGNFLCFCLVPVLSVLLGGIGFKSCGEQEQKYEPTSVIIEGDSDAVANDSIAFPTAQQLPTTTTVVRPLSFTVNGVTFKMLPVAAGSFMMGATPEQRNSDSDEKPVHRVTLTKDYYMGETEVTQALWRAVMGSNSSYFKGNNRPVECVSWKECQIFICKLNNLLAGQLPSDKSFRLPTGAEWEFAARGGNRSRGYLYSGSNNLSSVGWYGGNSDSTTHDVKEKSPNELGFYDMNGNVLEWCNDWYDSSYSTPQTDSHTPSSDSYRVYRGGSWFSNARCCRVVDWGCIAPRFKSNHLGLRLAL